MQAINDFVLIKPDVAPTETEGGIIIPIGANSFIKRLATGEVLSVGEKATTISKGDRVMFYQPYDDGDIQELMVVRLESIVGIE